MSDPVYGKQNKRPEGYTTLIPPDIFVDEPSRDRYFQENPDKLVPYEKDETKIVVIMWDSFIRHVKPKAMWQRRKDNEWDTVYMSHGTKDHHHFHHV